MDQTNSKFEPNFTPATTAEAQAGTNNTKVMTPLRVEEYTLANDIGWSQTWQDVLSSRAAGTAYQNTTGKPIMVTVAMTDSSQFQVSVDGTTWLIIAQADTDQDLGGQPGGFIIPNTGYYKVVGGINGRWVELR